MTLRYSAVAAAAFLLVAGAAVAQPASPSPANPSSPPVAGANSFTKGEAQKRIEASGFTQVAGLKKDDRGVWRGSAVKDGKTVTVSLDYQGNVVAE